MSNDPLKVPIRTLEYVENWFSSRGVHYELVGPELVLKLRPADEIRWKEEFFKDLGRYMVKDMLDNLNDVILSQPMTDLSEPIFVMKYRYTKD